MDLQACADGLDSDEVMIQDLVAKFVDQELMPLEAAILELSLIHI